MSIHTTEPTRFQCRHLFTDGRRCGSPCLRNEDFCYYHHTTRGAAANTYGSRRMSRVPHPLGVPHSRRNGVGGVVMDEPLSLPLPEDRSAIQLSIGLILQHLATGSLEPRRAGILLYGLQIASSNLPKPDPKARPTEPVDEIIHHPTHGPLAPAAELGHDEPMGSAERLLMELCEDDADQNHPEPQTIDLQAASAAELTPPALPWSLVPDPCSLRLPHLLRPRISRRHHRRNPTPRPEVPLHLRPHRVGRLHHVVQHLVHNVLLEDPQVPVREQVLLQRLQLQAPLARHIPDQQRPKVRQPRLRAHARKLRVVDQNLILGKLVPPGLNRGKLNIQPRLRMIVGISSRIRLLCHTPILSNQEN